MAIKEIEVKKLGNEFFLKRQGFTQVIGNIFGIKNTIIYLIVSYSLAYLFIHTIKPEQKVTIGYLTPVVIVVYLLSVFFIVCIYVQGGGVILKRFFQPKNNKNYSKDLESNLRKYFGRDFKYFDCFSYGGSYPCALGYDGKQILILDQGEYVFVNRSDMRSYGWRMHSPGVPATFHGGTFGQRTGAEWAENINVAQENAMKTNNSGFFVNCKSIDKPDWFIATGMGQERVCKKWDEIFHQINDGTLPINP